MKQQQTQRGALQVVALKPQTRVKKRSRQIMPELRSRIPGLFDITGGSYDRIAEEFGVPALDVIAETLRDTRRRMGNDPESRPFLVRAAA